MKHYEDLATLDRNILLPLLGHQKYFLIYSEVTLRKYDVKITSKRLRCFGLNPRCAGCSLEGKLFLLQRPKGTKETPHINFYGIDENGERVLMTKDHIQPRSKGGKDSLNNLQTMCYPCNQKKGSMFIQNEGQ